MVRVCTVMDYPAKKFWEMDRPCSLTEREWREVYRQFTAEWRHSAGWPWIEIPPYNGPPFTVPKAPLWFWEIR